MQEGAVDPSSGGAMGHGWSIGGHLCPYPSPSPSRPGQQRRNNRKEVMSHRHQLQRQREKRPIERGEAWKWVGEEKRARRERRSSGQSELLNWSFGLSIHRTVANKKNDCNAKVLFSSEFFSFRNGNTFVFICQLLSNYRITRLKKIHVVIYRYCVINLFLFLFIFSAFMHVL